jgi:hypothetical protein
MISARRGNSLAHDGLAGSGVRSARRVHASCARPCCGPRRTRPAAARSRSAGRRDGLCSRPAPCRHRPRYSARRSTWMPFLPFAVTGDGGRTSLPDLEPTAVTVSQTHPIPGAPVLSTPASAISASRHSTSSGMSTAARSAPSVRSHPATPTAKSKKTLLLVTSGGLG